MAGKRWTEAEDQIVKDKTAEGMTCEQIGKILNRTTRSVQHRFEALNLEKPNPKIGDKINRLTIIDLYNVNDGNQNMTYAKCKCECGNITDLRLTVVKMGKIKSCGCLRDEKSYERMSGINNVSYKHGQCGTRLHSIWNSMKARCIYPSSPSYKYYGEKGISVCKEWLDFNNFYNWAMSNGYTDELTIDRIDSSKNYEPDNCRWSTYYTQAQNKDSTIHLDIEIFGEKKDIADWMIDSRCIVSKTCFLYRLFSNWDPEKALTTPSERQKC